MLQDINGRVTDSADIGSNYKYKYENAQICVLPSVVKKKVATVLSIKAFSTMGLAL
jgi:hypothetical protein